MKKAIGYLVLVVLLVGAAFLIYRVFVPETPEFIYRLRFFARTEEVNLYFVRGEAVIPVTRRVARVREPEQKVRTVIGLLLEGPDESEKNNGFDTALPAGARFLSAFLQGNIVFLNFSAQIEEGGGTETMKTRLRQIVYTATQFDDVEKVSFLIEGQPIKYFSSEGLTEVEHPLGRAGLEMEER